MLVKTQLRYRMPSIKEGLARLFDIQGSMKDSFSVVFVKKQTANEMMALNDGAFRRAAERLNDTRASLGHKMRTIAIMNKD
ncbi:MAG: hypothetical protein GC158_15760 [Cyanobacteria bacterium RI_101]|nr:hypothetical protein [Cyanobacteria bacterium RI_101]